ncbi:hypothetical protein GIB67_003177 [Kingdonia uniflora]|uniref:DNA helicase Pif1-like 2B domain-containing protein n=1 Tax=Kingdonia uniflora TaxID=39325 RepID=A0A7J7N5Z0_9MAGN|nr:hypothetical protein GIB67_003177 [Kingdonia uniflora]
MNSINKKEEAKAQLLNENPLVASWFFQTRVYLFLKYFLKTELPVKDHSFWYEWKNRGSGHVHGFIWLEDAPVVNDIGTNSANDARIINYFDCLVCTMNPNLNDSVTTDEHPCARNLLPTVNMDLDDDDYSKLINWVMRHSRCGSYCQCLHKTTKQLVYRFRYPFDVLLKTGFKELPDTLQEIVEDIRRPCQTARSSIKRLLTKTVSERDISTQEVCHLLMSYHLERSSRKIVVLDMSNKRLLSTPIKRRQSNDDEDTSGADLNYVLRYMNRPSEYDGLSLFDMAQRHHYSRDTWVTPRVEAVVRIYPHLQGDILHNSEKWEAFCRQEPIAKIPSTNNCDTTSTASSDDAKGLENILYLSIGARVMLRSNLATQNGLVNGAMGTVVEIVYSSSSKPLSDLLLAVIIDFDNYRGTLFREGSNIKLPEICSFRDSLNIVLQVSIILLSLKALLVRVERKRKRVMSIEMADYSPEKKPDNLEQLAPPGRRSPLFQMDILQMVIAHWEIYYEKLMRGKSRLVCRGALSKRLNPEELKEIGNEEYKKGKFAEAIALYNRTIALNPTKATYKSNKSAALTGMGRFLEAVLECRAHHRLARLYLRLGKAENALYHFKQSGFVAKPKEISQAQALQIHTNRCKDAKRLEYYVKPDQECNVLRFEERVMAVQQAVQLDSSNNKTTSLLKRARAMAWARSKGNELFKASKFLEACVVYGECLEHDSINPGQFEKAMDIAFAAL